MKAKPVIARSSADPDVDGVIAHYHLERRAVEAALGLIDALEKTCGHIGRHPAAGSPRYAHELNLPDLRFWLVPGIRYVVFHVECDDHVDVWRILHAQRGGRMPVSVAVIRRFSERIRPFMPSKTMKNAHNKTEFRGNMRLRWTLLALHSSKESAPRSPVPR